MEGQEIVGKIVGFTIFGSEYFGKIDAFDNENDTYIIYEQRDLATGELFNAGNGTSKCIVELENHEIQEVYVEPDYYYISGNFDILSGDSEYDADHTEISHFPIRFSELANNQELLKFSPFVGNQIDEDNTRWFAGYLLALDKFDDSVEKVVAKHFLVNNPLVTIAIFEDYEHLEFFKKVYDKLDQSVKE